MKSEQYLVRVTADQVDIVDALLFLQVGSSAADVIRTLIEDERVRRRDDDRFATLLEIRSAQRSEDRRSQLTAVQELGS